jgi:hypothetical protein
MGSLEPAVRGSMGLGRQFRRYRGLRVGGIEWFQRIRWIDRF